MDDELYKPYYILKRLTDDEVKSMSGVIINGNPLIIPYKYNKSFFFVYRDRF